MVLQRIQTVYFLLVTILMAIYSFMNVVLVQSGDGLMEKLPLYSASFISFILSVFATILSFLTVFKYKKMNLQITLGCIGVIICLTQLVVLVLEVMSKGYIAVEFFICNCMPIASAILYILAIVAIRRDKKLLSGYDRIR